MVEFVVNVCVVALFGVVLLRASTCIGIGALLSLPALSLSLLPRSLALLVVHQSLNACTCLHSGGSLCFASWHVLF